MERETGFELRAKFGRSDQEVAETEERIRSFTHMIEPTQTLNVVLDDPDDNRVVECAVASDSDCIVTGGKDLLRLGQNDGIQNTRVAEFLSMDAADRRCWSKYASSHNEGSVDVFV